MRKIPFSDTQGNISDENGDLLMSSNGYFIANATGDTMQNGAGINPGLFTDDYGSTNGMILPYGNIILPMPSDSTRYVLFHQTGNYNSSTLASSEIFYSTIDMSLDGGLGAVTEKTILLQQVHSDGEWPHVGTVMAGLVGDCVERQCECGKQILAYT
ncbi:MAG: hypothetical protein IPG39_10210 [Bacteroidetes bacterium]|nr:hypothetical protein [Bacteroidota bacterium]